jgi:hypothetical protein
VVNVGLCAYFCDVLVWKILSNWSKELYTRNWFHK